MILTLPLLKACMPYAGDRTGIYLECLNTAAHEFGIEAPLRLASWLANIAHESGSLRYVEEIASGADYEGRASLGNTHVGDGIRFKGRGLAQITGRANYAACGAALGRDLIADPAYLSTPMGASRSAGWFFKSRNLGELADADRFWSICKAWNGGTNGLDERIAHYCRIRRVLGL